MIRRLCPLGLVALCVAGIAGADESATLVLTDAGQGRFTRELPAGVPVTIVVPILDVDPTRGTLTIYPQRDPDCADPGERGIQRREYGMSISGAGDARSLQATISPLQIATVYCMSVSYEHGLSAGKLDQLADMMSRTKIDWAASCASVAHDPAQPDEIHRVDRPPAEQIARVRTALADHLKESLGALRELDPRARGRMNREPVAPDGTRRVDDAAGALTDLLDVPSRCFTLDARRGDEDRASYESRRSAARQRDALDAVKQLPVEVRSWPAVVVSTGTTAVALPLLALLGQTGSLNALVAHVELADSGLAAELLALVDASATEAPARRDKLRARLSAPPRRPVPLVLFLPSANKSVRAVDLVRSGSFDPNLVVDLARARELILRQLELLRPQDKRSADRWIAAITKLAGAVAAAVDDDQHYQDAQKARMDAEAAIAPHLKLLVQTEVMKNLLRKTEIVRDRPPAASRETDDKASWIAPTVGVMVAAPLLLHEGRFTDPWLVPYLGASVYFTRVDRVIDVGDLVGPESRLFWQRNSFSAGLLLSRPSLRSTTIAGPWNADVVPFLGFGHRFTQYLRADLGAIVFQYNDRIPVITQLHWGLAGWLGVSLDADVWAVFSGKLGR